VSDLTEDELRKAVLKIDLLLKRRQAFWESPRNLALIIAAVAAIAGVVGFKLGNAPTRIEVSQPFHVQLETRQ
jgi:hypothetical protein